MRSWILALLIGGLALAGCKGKEDEVVEPATPTEEELEAHDDAVSAVIKAGKPDVKACGATDKTGAEAAVGKVSLTFVIEPDGKVSKTVVEESSTNSEGADACVQAVVQAWEFPAHPLGESIEYTYPFDVSP